MVTAKLIDRDEEYYIYEYRPNDGDDVGMFGVTDDLKYMIEINPAKCDIANLYRRKALTAIKSLFEETGELPPQIVMQW